MVCAPLIGGPTYSWKSDNLGVLVGRQLEHDIWMRLAYFALGFCLFLDLAREQKRLKKHWAFAAMSLCFLGVGLYSQPSVDAQTFFESPFKGGLGLIFLSATVFMFIGYMNCFFSYEDRWSGLITAIVVLSYVALVAASLRIADYSGLFERAAYLMFFAWYVYYVVFERHLQRLSFGR